MPPTLSSSIWAQIQRGESPSPPPTPATGGDDADANAQTSSQLETHAASDDMLQTVRPDLRALPLPPSADTDVTLRNIRLLDLDRRADYPGITASTFHANATTSAAASIVTNTKKTGGSAVRGKTRIACAEWLLYNLFELYDAREAKEKLGAYYPALEPRQSSLLRAALLNMLVALKTSGVLPKDCALRKSLLDECAGTRFEECLYWFSSVVLRKVVLDQDRKARTALSDSLVESLLLCSDIGQDDEEHMAVLTLAFRRGIYDAAKEKELTGIRLAELSRKLHAERERLERGKERDEVDIVRADTLLKQAKVNATQLKRQLRDECAANLDVINLAISGDNNTDRSAAIEVPFNRLWIASMAEENVKADAIPASILANLELRVAEQKSRLENWRAFQATLSARNQELTVYQSPFKTPGRSPAKVERRPSARHRRTESASKVAAESPSKLRSTSPVKKSLHGTGSVASASHDLSSVMSTDSPLHRRDTGHTSPARPLQPSLLRRTPTVEESETTTAGEDTFVANRRANASAPPVPQPASNLPGITRPSQLTQRQASDPLTEQMSKLSLAERTMLSMRQADELKKKRESFLSSFHPSAQSQSQSQSHSQIQSLQEDDKETADTLASRTRASMANARLHESKTNLPPRKREHRKSRSISAAYPVNPWDAPEPEPARAVKTIEEENWNRPQTPTDVLFADGVEAESVFKTRSKMRRSPPPFV